jgi:hypothetical protein
MQISRQFPQTRKFTPMGASQQWIPVLLLAFSAFSRSLFLFFKTSWDGGKIPFTGD